MHRPLEGGASSAATAAFDDDLRDALAGLEARDLLRADRPLRRRSGGEVELAGRRLVDLASNDYLGLAADPAPAAAAARFLREEGVGAGAARLLTGTHPVHRALEDEVAAFLRRPAALLFGSGSAANLGAIPALAGEGDLLYSDARNHASIIDGCRLSRAQVRVFPHGDLEALTRLLAADRGRSGARWIVVEGVYSMDGDLFPLEALVPLARDHGARIYLDDAHGFGVLGAAGRGTAERLGVEGEVDVLMGTFGKAVGASGAFVAGSEALRCWLLNRARSFVFATAPPPAIAAAARVALEALVAGDALRRRLAANAARLGRGLATQGIRPPRGAAGHVVPVPVGDPAATLALAAALETRGYLVGAIRPPSVAPGTARLRIGVSAAHTADQIDGFVAALGTLLPAHAT